MTWGEDEWTPQRWVKKVLWKRQSNATFYLRLLMVLWMLRWVHVCLFVSCHHWPWYGPLTYQRQILLYVLSQVSIHYLPVEDVLRQLRLLVVYVLLKSCFLLFFFFFFWALVSRSLTICSLMFDFPTFSRISAAAETRMEDTRLQSENVNTIVHVVNHD